MRALGRSPQRPELFCAPGNAGIAAEARCLNVGAEDVDGIVRAAADEKVELVVVGPEAPLVAGVVDALEEDGIAAFGPSGEAARLEGSKLHAKKLMEEAGVPTASHAVVRSRKQALDDRARGSYPSVLKADGLAAGKGVIDARRASPSSRNRPVARSQCVRASGRLEGNAMNPAARRWIRAEM